MDWMDQDVEIDAAQAALLAAGMREVAKADGRIREEEIRLIASLEQDLPADTKPAATVDAALHEVYARSLLMVALADGEITDKERLAIYELTQSHGLDADRVDAAEAEVKRFFLNALSGVRLFRGAVERIAGELGVSLDEA